MSKSGCASLGVEARRRNPNAEARTPKPERRSPNAEARAFKQPHHKTTSSRRRPGSKFARPPVLSA
ncbi:hypothetical protein B0920_14300 [Massilia sp. KIM]|nr:hypothetical protein B0920_14300 [Massilia sp. KIM]